MNGPVVNLSGVTKTFGRFKAVDDISFDITQGSFVTLLGPSGCGKTTTLRMIGGLERPDSGRIEVAGRPLHTYRGPRRPTRMVFQSYALFPHMTVGQNVAFGLKTKGVPDAELQQKTKDILQVVDLTVKADQYPRQLSGGQQQRVALARALVTEPLVLLLDEPLSALDFKMRKRMQVELKELQRRVGITFVYVTHDQEEAMALSDTIVVMQQGTVAQIGTPEEIYNDPTNTYVADFIGAANVIRGRVVRLGEGTALLEIPERVVWARTRKALNIGDAVSAILRPEHIRVERALPDADGLHGVVAAASFVGTSRRYEIQTGVARITAEAPAHSDFRLADPVVLSWDTKHLLALQT